ncbi:MAG: hypothetical protein EHM45_09235 [Desulfobacteraceae bacterium]|nr:MAG: hypothetical protein EHM45_09235 [Desulfobacteraceae bacterium]
MIVICEECGQKHEIEASIAQRKTKMKCKSCNHLMAVQQPKKGTGKQSADAATGMRPAGQKNAGKKTESASRFTGIGLRGKLMLFFLVPLILALSAGGIFTLRVMDTLGRTMTGESLKMLVRVSENEVQEYSKAIAQQIQIYLAIHSDLKKEDFNNDIEFKKIAVQRINLTMRGYTSLYEPTEDGKLIFWAHVNPKYVGQDVSSLKDLVGQGFSPFEKIIRGGRGGIETSGRYVQEIEGRSRDNYLVCTPVKGTPYYVSCTTYLDESTLGVVAIPMSPAFKNYLDLIVWPQENEWWKKK